MKWPKVKREPKLETSTGSLFLKIGEPSQKMGRKNFRSQREWRRPGEPGLPNPLSRDHRESQRMKRQAWGLQGSVPGPRHCVMTVNLVFYGIPICGSGCISDSLVCFWESFPPIGFYCLVVGSFVLSHCTLSCPVDCCLLKAYFFLMGERAWVDPRRGELERVEGVETVVNVYCLTEESIFN